MNAEIAAVEYTAQKDQPDYPEIYPRQNPGPPEGGTSVDPAQTRRASQRCAGRGQEPPTKAEGCWSSPSDRSRQSRALGGSCSEGFRGEGQGHGYRVLRHGPGCLAAGPELEQGRDPPILGSRREPGPGRAFGSNPLMVMVTIVGLAKCFHEARHGAGFKAQA